jgi:catechol 2,3-dioxygenase-like lactoylglutathione lyase family enzyme
MVIDHIGFNVRDVVRSKTLYLAALAPLGIRLIKEGAGWAMIGRPGDGDLWLGSLGAAATPVHVAFRAATREQVRQFHAAALAAGAKDNGAPGLRPNYHSNYYGAFVIDFDGHNIEAVCHAPEA